MMTYIPFLIPNLNNDIFQTNQKEIEEKTYKAATVAHFQIKLFWKIIASLFNKTLEISLESEKEIDKRLFFLKIQKEFLLAIISAQRTFFAETLSVYIKFRFSKERPRAPSFEKWGKELEHLKSFFEVALQLEDKKKEGAFVLNQLMQLFNQMEDLYVKNQLSCLKEDFNLSKDYDELREYFQFFKNLNQSARKQVPELCLEEELDGLFKDLVHLKNSHFIAPKIYFQYDHKQQKAQGKRHHLPSKEEEETFVQSCVLEWMSDLIPRGKPIKKTRRKKPAPILKSQQKSIRKFQLSQEQKASSLENAFDSVSLNSPSETAPLQDLPIKEPSIALIQAFIPEKTREPMRETNTDEPLMEVEKPINLQPPTILFFDKEQLTRNALATYEAIFSKQAWREAAQPKGRDFIFLVKELWFPFLNSSAFHSLSVFDQKRINGYLQHMNPTGSIKYILPLLDEKKNWKNNEFIILTVHLPHSGREPIPFFTFRNFIQPGFRKAGIF